MPARLYVVHGSHPCAAAARAMDMKGFAYDVVELLPPLHAALQRVRFGVRTVPGLVLESGEKLSGSRTIMRRLEELAPEPALLGGRSKRTHDSQREPTPRRRTERVPPSMPWPRARARRTADDVTPPAAPPRARTRG